MSHVKSLLLQSRTSFMPLKKQPKSARNRLVGVQTCRTAYEANKLHIQCACPGGFLSPMAGLRAPRSVLKPFIRRFKGRLCLSDNFYWRWGAPKRCLMRCRHWFRSFETVDKAMTPRSVEPCSSLSQTHARTHTHTHTHPHPHTRARTHACTHAITCVRTDTHTHAP